MGGDAKGEGGREPLDLAVDCDLEATLAEAGAHVLIAARDRRKLDSIETEIRSRGGAVSTYACDITDAAASAELARQLLA